MHQPLRHLDLNLLPVFDALYRHRSVTGSANELALSPSALSHALSRLRAALDDPLFVRQGNQMQPTPKAENLARTIAEALSGLSAGLGNSDDFSPLTGTQTFTFAATDYTAAVFFPGLIARLQKLAPGIVIKIVYSREYDAMEELLTGRVDFSIGFEEIPMLPRKGLATLDLFSDDYVVAVRKGHPFVRSAMTRADYLQLGHVVVKPWNEPRRSIDEYLSQQQVKRKIVVELPSVMSAPHIVTRTDLAITLPRRGIMTLFDTSRLAVYPPPFTIPEYTLKAYFNPALCNSKGHLWMKEHIAQIS